MIQQYKHETPASESTVVSRHRAQQFTRWRFVLVFAHIFALLVAAPAWGFEPTAFFKTYCMDCHGDVAPEGSLSLSRLTPAALSDNAEVWSKAAEVLLFKQMPPEDADQPSDAEVEQVTTWIKNELIKKGLESDIEHKLKQPSYANLLNHEKLFNGAITGPASSPPRLWRLHPQGYDSFLLGFGRELDKGGPLSKPFTVADGKGLASNYAELMQADSATLGQLMLNCKQIAELQTVGLSRQEQDRKTQAMVEKIYRKSPPSFSAIIESEAPASDAQMQAAVTEEFQLILTRPPSADEADSYFNLLKQAIEIGGKERGLRTMAMAVLLKPEAIYRMEVGLGKTDEHGRRMLSPYELAFAISYALTDLPPTELLLGPPKPNDRSKRPQPPSLMDIANEGKLQTREDVGNVLETIWGNDAIDKPRILRFFHEFFGYDAARTVFKGDRANREFAPDKLVHDADTLVLHFVEQDRDVLKQLLTTERYFVQWPGSVEEYNRRVEYIANRIKPDNTKDRNYQYFVERVKGGLRPIPQANPTWRATVRFYNLHEDDWNYPLEQPFEMPQGQRVGILTHPAWLAAWSGNFENDPIRRGKWIREHLLAGAIPDVPITVNAAVPEDPHKTLRDRLQVTRETYCWQCHQKMDPLGLPFEAYTDFGRYRTDEGLGHPNALQKPKNTLPLATHGEIIASGDDTINGEVKDVHELMHKLANSPRVQQSFVRHAFRYWLGRNEMITDSPTLIAANKAYGENEGSFKAMVIELLTSDSFLYRK